MCIFNNLYFLSTFLTACCRLVTEDVISHVCEPQPFKDAYLFFRFTVLLPFPHVSHRYNETTKTPCTLPSFPAFHTQRPYEAKNERTQDHTMLDKRIQFGKESFTWQVIHRKKQFFAILECIVQMY